MSNKVLKLQRLLQKSKEKIVSGERLILTWFQLGDRALSLPLNRFNGLVTVTMWKKEWNGEKPLKRFRLFPLPEPPS